MEYERSIFRVHQRMMTDNKCKGFISCFATVMLAMGLLNFFVLVAGHISYKNGTGAVTAALQDY